MSTRSSRGLSGVWAGVVGLLVLAGCEKTVKPPAQPPSDDQFASAPPTTAPAPLGGGQTSLTPPVPSTSPAVGPGTPVLPGGTGVNPSGTTPPSSVFAPPTSPTFTAPETLGGAQVPGTPAQPPKPTDPAPIPQGQQQPPATGPATPADPPPTGTLQPDPAKPTTPPEPKYPEKIGGKDLKGWLKELEYPSGPVQKDDQIRETAVKVIPGFGPSARKPAVKPLIDAIRADPDPGVQIAAITVVSNMGFEMREEVRPVIQVLIQRLANSSNGNIVRMYCVRSLASFGPDAVGAVQRMRDVSGDQSWETRREVAIALSMIGATPVDDKGKPKKDHGPDLKAIDTLLTFQMQDSSVAVRLEAAKSLLALGPPFAKTPQEFIKDTEKPRETMEKVLKFESGKAGKANTRGGAPDRGVYVWALLLQLMYDDRKISDNMLELAKLVKEPDSDQVRLFAIQAIGAAGSLFPALGERDRTLDDKNKVAVKVVRAVTDALAYEHEPILVYTAMTTLALIGKEARDAVPALEKLAAKPAKVPEGAPKGTPPDDSLQKMAKQTVEVITGKRKMEDFGKEEVKAALPKEPEKK